MPPEGDGATALTPLGLVADDALELPALRHSFTHFHLHIEPRLIRLARPPLLDGATWHWLPLAEVEQAALPTPVRKLLLDVRQLMPAANAAR
ncbi:MAG TPA: NUDIX domain-containing protein [Rhodocyclaceae bacterium]|nr:NUDIX domain-containing protein [Rhodocyclaceae bacterium]